MSSEFASLWHRAMFDLDRPDIGWQVAALCACLLAAFLIDRFVNAREMANGAAGRLKRFSYEGLARVTFSVALLLLVVLVRAVLQPYVHVSLLSLVVPLMGSLAIIQAVFHVLRHAFPGSPWLGSFERVFALLVWSVVVAHVTGLLPEVIDSLESVKFQMGKSSVTLWQVLQGMVTVLATGVVALWGANAMTSRLERIEGMDPNMRIVMVRVTKTVSVVLAVLIGLPLVGIDLTTLSVFGGALGVGIGFGLQKTASNYISGFILLLDRSISIGDIIAVGEDRGVVKLITTRYTVLRQYNGVDILVPNELLVTSVVRNESYSDQLMRLSVLVRVSYDSDLEKAFDIMLAAAKAESRVLPEPPPEVRLKEFADNGIVLEMGFWINDPLEGTGNLRSAINLSIWRDFKAAGIIVPFPQREVRILSDGAVSGRESS